MEVERDVMEDSSTLVRRGVEVAADQVVRMIAVQDAFETHSTEMQTLEEGLIRVRAIQNPTSQTQQFEWLVQQRMKQKTAELQHNHQQMINLKTEFWNQIQSNIKNISEMYTSIFKKQLILWKLQQKRAANFLTTLNPISLETLQRCSEQLADLIWRSRQQFQSFEGLQSRNIVFANGSTEPNNSKAEVESLLSNLLNDAFIVEEQPSQVMRKGTKFANFPMVSILVGNMNIHMSAPRVNSYIIKEAMARSLTSPPSTDEIIQAGRIINGTANLEQNSVQSRPTAKFPNIQLSAVANRRGSRVNGGNANAKEHGSVMEAKLCLLFESQVIIGDFSLKIRTMSLPIVIISHGSQEAVALASIMWDNAFGLIDRVPFQVPSSVPWSELAEVISARFMALADRGLDEGQLECLKRKAMRSASNSEMIGWSEFRKDKLPNQTFSFCDWLFAASKTIEKNETHLKGVWKDGLLMGFVERQAAQNLLEGCLPGTFILRFSDSTPGSISTVCINEDREVLSIEPKTLPELMTKPLANEIRDKEPLKYLYPYIPKDVAFQQHYTRNQPRRGYVTWRAMFIGSPTTKVSLPGTSTSMSNQMNGGVVSHPTTPTGYIMLDMHGDSNSSPIASASIASPMESVASGSEQEPNGTLEYPESGSDSSMTGMSPNDVRWMINSTLDFSILEQLEFEFGDVHDE